MAENLDYDISIIDSFKLARAPESEPVKQERIDGWNEILARDGRPMLARATSWRHETMDTSDCRVRIITEYIEAQAGDGRLATQAYVRWNNEPDVYELNPKTGRIYTFSAQGSVKEIPEPGSAVYLKVKRGLGLLANEAFGL